MKCPICNAKMYAKNFCPYCKIYASQVFYASNLEAKKSLKNGLKDEVTLSKTRPYDVDKTKFLLLTIFLGLFGVHNYYIGRTKRGIFFNISFIITIITTIILNLNDNYWNNATLNMVLNTFIYFGALLIFLWVADIFTVAITGFKYPIKVATLDEVQLREKKYE